MSDLDLTFGFPTRARVVRPSVSTLYITVLGTGVLGSMAWRAVSEVVGPALDARLAPAFALAWGLALAGAVLMTVRRVGPAGMARGALTWCLGSPTVTTMLLRRSLLGRTVLAAAAGLVAGLVTALVQRADWRWTLIAGGGGALLGVALAAAAAVDQARERRWSARAGAVAVLAGGTLWYLCAFDVLDVPVTVLPVGAAAVLLVALAGVVTGARRLRRAVLGGRYDLRELARAGEVTERLGAAAAMMAASPLHGASRPRRRIRMPKRFAGQPVWITLVDLRRILARPVTLLVMAALVPLPGSVARAGHDGLAGVVLVLLGYAAMTRLALWWRSWEDSSALPAWLPFDDRTALFALLAAPLLVLLVLAAVSAALAGLAPGWVWSTVAAALFGGRFKIATERMKDEIWVTTEAGAVPLVRTLKTVAGWDVALIVGLVSLLLW